MATHATVPADTPDPTVAELIAARREAYARAPITIDTSDLSIEQAADAAIAAFTEYAAKSWPSSASPTP